MTMLERLRINKTGLVASLAAAGALAFTASYTLGGFSATIDNSSNAFSSATVQLEEVANSTDCYSTGTGTGGTVTASNTGTCATNLMSAESVPGSSGSVTLTLENIGNHATTSSSLTPATTCSVAAASTDGGYVGSDTSGFCGLVEVTVLNATTGNCVYPAATGACTLSSSDTLATLVSAGALTAEMSSLAVNGSAQYTITTELSSAATNADQGLAATVPLTWAINQ